ncbi:transposase [Colwellia sp. MB02u-10]|uniref:DDE-type integrase/transposase/recombinase n=1 Tax=Colwellia sp. MB02u-10 TaxID=2759828 RepID=UPI0015F53052|nr:DDE-type integrase/transposase/recombinase [Colwellia sp. MB02u-10]MBA6340982.1 transposase [Colwellia sp. MB02u-10]
MNTFRAGFLRENTNITWGSQGGHISAVHADYVVLMLDGEPELFKTRQVVEAISGGNLQILEPEKAIVYDAIHTSEQFAEYEYIKAHMGLLQLEADPTSESTHERVSLKAQVLLKLDKAISISGLYRMHQKYKAYGGHIQSMVVKPARQRKSSLNEASENFFFDVIWDVYMQLNGPSRGETLSAYNERYADLPKAKQKEIKLIKKTQFYTRIENLDTLETLRAREGEEAARRFARSHDDVFMADHVKQRYELDAVHLNVPLLSDDRTKYIGKIILYVAIDVYSRAIAGYYMAVVGDDELCCSKGEDSSGVIKMLNHVMLKGTVSKYAINPWPLSGAAVDFVCDAGTAFNNEAISSYVSALGGTLVVTQSASPWKKPFVERFFRTLRGQFAKHLPGYLGNSSDRSSGKNIVGEVATLTKSDVTELLERHILDTYHTNPHCGLQGRTPLEVASSNNANGMYDIPADIGSLKYDFGKPYTRQMGANGIICLKGFEFSNGASRELFLRRSKTIRKSITVKVLFRNQDISTVSLIDPVTLETIVVGNRKVKTEISLAEYKALQGDKPPVKIRKSLSNNAAQLAVIENAKKQKKLSDNNKRSIKRAEKRSSAQVAPNAEPLTPDDLDNVLAQGGATTGAYVEPSQQAKPVDPTKNSGQTKRQRKSGKK